MRPAGGFSLVELLGVLAVLSVLAMLVMPLAEMAEQRQKERELKRALWTIRDALDAYKQAVDNGVLPRQPGGSGYPPSLGVLAEGVLDAKGQPQYFLRQVPADPFAPEGVPAEQGWALRSYASPPDAPTPGVDVFDVHSTSDRVGLNGVPLKAW